MTVYMRALAVFVPLQASHFTPNPAPTMSHLRHIGTTDMTRIEIRSSPQPPPRSHCLPRLRVFRTCRVCPPRQAPTTSSAGSASWRTHTVQRLRSSSGRPPTCALLPADPRARHVYLGTRLDARRTIGVPGRIQSSVSVSIPLSLSLGSAPVSHPHSGCVSPWLATTAFECLFPCELCSECRYRHAALHQHFAASLLESALGSIKTKPLLCVRRVPAIPRR